MTRARVDIRAVREGDGDDLVDTWDDGRSFYASIDVDVFQAPDPETPVDADAFVKSLRDADAKPHRFARVAEVEGRAVGYIVARLDEPMPDAAEQLLRDLGQPRGYVEALGVHRSVWRHGVGTALMKTAEQWARAEGAVVMKTDTSLASPVSVPFYEALGYDRQAVILRKEL